MRASATTEMPSSIPTVRPRAAPPGPCPRIGRTAAAASRPTPIGTSSSVAARPVPRSSARDRQRGRRPRPRRRRRPRRSRALERGPDRPSRGRDSRRISQRAIATPTRMPRSPATSTARTSGSTSTSLGTRSHQPGDLGQAANGQRVVALVGTGRRQERALQDPVEDRQGEEVEVTQGEPPQRHCAGLQDDPDREGDRHDVEDEQGRGRERDGEEDERGDAMPRARRPREQRIMSHVAARKASRERPVGDVDERRSARS